MPNSPLPVSRLINISVSLVTAAAQAQNEQGMLILGSSPVIDTTTRYRIYDGLSALANDFSQSDPEYLAAIAWFSQLPQPAQVLIGRWAQAATSGQLFGASLGATQQASLIVALQAITTGSLTISIDGSSHNLTALNFSAINNLNGAAAVLQTALNSAAAGTTCVWNSNYGYFVITSPTTGASSAISFATAEGTGVDVSAPLGLRSTSSGAYVVAGIVAESALAAVEALDTIAGTLWYGLFVCGAADADHEAIAPYIEADTLFHFYGVNTQEAAVLNPSSTTDIAYILSQAKYTRTAVQYSSSSNYGVVSLLARIMTTGYTENNSVITLMYKGEPTIVPELPTETQIAALEAKSCSIFVSYDNNTAIIEPGITTAGAPWFIDTRMGVDALVLAIQTAIFNVLFGTTTKVPQTDAGMHLIATAITQVMVQFVSDGLLGTGPWGGPAFGSIVNGQTIPGFYVFAPTIASQPASNRVNRISVPFQVAAKLAGAVHTVDVALTVND